MLSDPQSLTISGTPTSLPRVLTNGRASTYEVPSGDTALVINHNVGKQRERSIIRVDSRKVFSDPLQSGVSRMASYSAQLHIDRPIVGVSDAEAEDLANALLAYAGASGLLARILGGEH